MLYGAPDEMRNLVRDAIHAWIKQENRKRDERRQRRTIKDLAEMAGVSYNHVVCIYAGQRGVSFQVANAILKPMGKRLAYVIQDLDQAT